MMNRHAYCIICKHVVYRGLHFKISINRANEELNVQFGLTKLNITNMFSINSELHSTLPP